MPNAKCQMPNAMCWCCFVCQTSSGTCNSHQVIYTVSLSNCSFDWFALMPRAVFFPPNLLETGMFTFNATSEEWWCGNITRTCKKRGTILCRAHTPQLGPLGRPGTDKRSRVARRGAALLLRRVRIVKSAWPGRVCECFKQVTIWAFEHLTFFIGIGVL